jgi:pimeloyl-ACP methyl ester carboxylesterase
MKLNDLQRSPSSVFVEGVEVPYHVAGSPDNTQPILVMVHGSTGSTDSHFGYLFPLLAFRQRVVSIDLVAPATGQSLRLEDLVAQVIAVIDAVAGKAPVSLMGYSLGAVVAAAVAAERPGSVANLVLVAGWIKTDAQQRLRNRIWHDLRSAEIEAIRNFMVFCAFSPNFVAARTTDELRGMAEKINLNAFVDQQMALNSDIDISDRVGNIQATTLIVGCSHDMMVPKNHSLQLFGAIDDARYTEIESGHGVVFERPAELLRLIDTFLRNPSAFEAGSIIPAARP